MGNEQAGKVLLMSSGETSASGHGMYHHVFATLPRPIRVAILETPAGFELNSTLVARKVADFINISLQNFAPSIEVIPARRRDGPLSTNDPKLLAPMGEANFLYMGAGSPSYLVRHLKDTLALKYLLRRHQGGAAICLASAAAIAFGSKTLPVYEIYKAGHDLHWIDGINFFGRFGLDLAIVTHWDNREGGAQLDTSRCYMGRSRMAQLMSTLPPTTLVLGIDEHTGVVLDFQSESCQVIGKGGLTIIGRLLTNEYKAGETFPIHRLGPYRFPSEAPVSGLPVGGVSHPIEPEPELPQAVIELVRKREELRWACNWQEADSIRQRLNEMGFEVLDMKEGSRVRTKGPTC